MNTTAAVSIGRLGGTEYDARNDRRKGFILRVHRNEGDLVRTLAKAAEESTMGSRVTVRVLIGREFDAALAASVRVPWRDGVSLSYEASVPVHQANIGSVLYFGANLTARGDSSQITQNVLIKLQELKQGRPYIRRIAADAFALEHLDAITLRPGDIDRIVDIYRYAFSDYVVELNADLVHRMIQGNMVIVAREKSSGAICGITQAEIAPVEVEGVPWRIVELSDTAVHGEFHGKGVGYLVKQVALHNIRGMRANTIVYSEARANHLAIVKLNVELGLENSGFLPRHCRINSSLSDNPQDGLYGDLLVMHMPLSTQHA